MSIFFMSVLKLNCLYSDDDHYGDELCIIVQVSNGLFFERC